MFLNSIQKPKHQSHFIDRFDGLCDEVVASQHKWRYMENMSGATFPSIGTRKPYQVLRTVSEDCQVLLHKKPLLLQNGKLYEGDREVANLGLLDGQKRSYAGMGEALVLFPDKAIYNTNTGQIEPMEARVRKSGLRFSLADAFGEAYTGYTISDTEPENRQLWLDNKNRKLKRWSNGVYESIQSLYICIEGQGVGEAFAAGEAIHLAGITEYPDLNRSFIVENSSADSLVLLGYLPQVFVEQGEVQIQRSLPDMDRLCVWNNRLWGINSKKCEIYASKLGNPKTFEAFSGLSSDSYMLTLEEEPLQIMALEEELLVFCEQAVYRITGTRPQNFRCVRLNQSGLRRGSEESVQVLGNGLYYLGQEGIYHYNGLFRRINRGVLGNLGDCKAFVQGRNYYLCQVNGEEEGIFVYDTERDFWHKEASYVVKDCAGKAKVAYFVVSNKLLAIGKADSDLKEPLMPQEGTLHWYAETPDFSLTLPDKRTLDMLQVMLSGKGDYAIFAAFDVDPAEKDNSRIPWEIVDADVFRGQQAIRVPICARPCHTMRLRISGNGEATIYSILRSIYEIYEED